jgi:hypothetical protein
MLSVAASDVSEGWIKGGLAEATATKQTKERFTPCINRTSIDSIASGCVILKTEYPIPEVANPSSTPSSQFDDMTCGLYSPDYFTSAFVCESPGHSPIDISGLSPQFVFPGSRSESCDNVEDIFACRVPAISSFDCLLVKSETNRAFGFESFSQSSAENFSQGCAQSFSQGFFQNVSDGSLCNSSKSLLGSLSQNSLPPSVSCENVDENLDWDVALPVKVVAVTVKTNLSKKIDLEKLCEIDSTHFGFRVAKLGPDCSPEPHCQSQDFRNSIQYLLQFPAVCEDSCKKFTGRIFNNGTVTISSIKTQSDIIGTVDQCLHAVVQQISMAHNASVTVGSVVVQNFEAGCLTFADPQFSLNLTFPLGFLVNYPKLRSIFCQGNEFPGLDDTKIVINSAKAEQKCGQGVFLKITQSKLKLPEELFHASFTIFHTGTVQARATCKNLEEMEFLLSNMYHILNLHRSEITPAGPEEEFMSKRKKARQNASDLRSHPYADAPSKPTSSRKKTPTARA